MSLELKSKFDLSGFNTLGLKSEAEQFVRIKDVCQIPELISYVEEQDLPLLWLGGGSNLVLGESVPGVVAQLALTGRELLSQDDDSVLLRTAAGEVWHEFVRWTLEQGYYGLENLALIPGSVGASPVQNIGAYGVEVCDSIEQVHAFDRASSKWVQLKSAECGFGYRDSIFKREPGRYVITSVEFRLSRNFQPRLDYSPLSERFSQPAKVTALEVFEAVCEVRRSKLPDPAQLGNAGSFFKNPVVTQLQFEKLLTTHPKIPNYPAETGRKLAAGWLIQQAGLKGYTEGAVGVHKLQALVLVNYGGANRTDIERLANRVKQQVQTEFDVLLEQEPIAYP